MALTQSAALPLLGFSPQIWGFPTRSRGLGFFLGDLGFFLGFFKKSQGFVIFPRKIHILECFLLESKCFLVRKYGTSCCGFGPLKVKNLKIRVKKMSPEIFSTKAAFFKKSSIFSRKSSIFSSKSSIFPQNLYKFDLGFSGGFSVARLGFSIFQSGNTDGNWFCKLG